ncbi:hypothetical protein DSO57_1034952 [Entomophthora muscae]|uniref:Uncharacterized protein n=1 Tax=Entomophthora muscae TaxID=34485 RepID=A0ACC2RQK4_9FUNG|nr:hypothetical protein DSO57_1034952 [Entomophthora muscae]
MPQMGKLTLEEARRAMPVFRLHFQANTNSYSNDTEKVLGVAPMLSGNAVVNAAIHHVLILPSLGYFKDKYLSFAFALWNEAGSKLGNTIVQLPDPAQLTCPIHACGE